MLTSDFRSVRLFHPGLEPVAISAGVPVWFKGRREPRLAPTRAMLQLTVAGFVRAYARQLRSLDARAIFKALGDNAVLLCWERPGVKCHRRLVAEWFERDLGVEVTEFGFDRADVLACDDLPHKSDRPPTKKRHRS